MKTMKTIIWFLINWFFRSNNMEQAKRQRLADVGCESDEAKRI